MKRLIGIAVVGAITSAACGPANTFSGTIQSQSFVPLDSIFFVDSNGSGQDLTMILSSQPGLCARAQLGGKLKSSTLLEVGLSVFDSAATPQPLVTGAYTVYTLNEQATGNVANADFEKLDDNCASQLSSVAVEADTGTLTLSSFDARTSGVASGTFSMQFGADAATGTFNANWCDLTGRPNTQTCN